MLQSEDTEPPAIEVQFAIDGQPCPSESKLIAWAQSALQHKAGGLTIRVVKASEIRSLNSQFRAKDTTTNVLSFPSDLPPELGLAYLGDIVVCAEVVNNEAREYAKSNDAHWAHMLVHGVLHLRGFDHVDTAGAKEMEGLEIALLADLGFSNPYDITTTDRVNNV